MVESLIDDDQYESFPLGSYTGLFLQVTANMMQKLAILPKLIEPNGFSIEGKTISLFINEVNEIILNKEINLSHALKEQLQSLLHFLHDKNFDEWRIYSF